MKHTLKILPPFFEAARIGKKCFEIRDNTDRGFQAGDAVTLREFDPERLDELTREYGAYTGRELIARIDYVSNYQQRRNIVVFGFTITEAVVEWECCCS